VSECLLERIRCRTLFATHYHELALMTHPRLANRSLLVDETGGEIVFRRRLVEGAAAESYGLHVAGLAGLPADVLRRAAEIMATLQSASGTEAAVPAMPVPIPPKQEDDSAATAVLEELADFDVETASPLDALNQISEWKQRLAYRQANQTDPDIPSLFE
jgi:DNA mismatch repair protein MutS